MRVVRFAIAGALALLAAACLPVQSTTPVGKTVGFRNDPALLGMWQGKTLQGKNNSAGYFHFLANDNNTITAVVVSHTTKTEQGDWTIYTLSTATLGGNRYMNVIGMLDSSTAHKPAKPEAGSIPLRYTLNGDALTLYIMDEDKIEAMVKAHKIEGKFVGDPKSFGGTDILLTADAAHLDALMKAPGADKPFIVLKRMK